MLTISLRRKRAVAAMALAVTIAFVYVAYTHFSTIQFDKTQPMTPYTESMKTKCVGRYLLDIPATYAGLGYGQEIDGIPITKLSDTVSTVAEYEKVIKRERAQVDKKILDEKEMGANFIKETVISPKAIIFIYSLKEILTARQKELYDGSEPSHNIAGFVWVGNRVYKMLISYDRKTLEATQSKFLNLANSFQPWDGVTLPTGAGVCIDEAFIAGGPFERGELVSFGADIDKDQNTRIGFTTRGGSKSATDGVLKPMPGTTLIERARNADELVKDKKGLDYKSLRRTSRAVLGQPGEEIVNRIEEKGEIELQGKIEVTGGGDPKRQYYSFNINSKNTRSDQQTGAKTAIDNPIQVDTALAVWDKFVSSLRIRPAAF